MIANEIIKKHYLLPSRLFVDQEKHLVSTVLGSCISVCLYNPRLKVGGINHYMLPLWNSEGLATPKYGNIATEKLVEKMIALGSQKSELIAKVFGGANQLSKTNNGMNYSIGDRNYGVAKDILNKHGIKIVAESVGGFRGRKMLYNTYTGEVKMKFLTKSN